MDIYDTSNQKKGGKKMQRRFVVPLVLLGLVVIVLGGFRAPTAPVQSVQTGNWMTRGPVTIDDIQVSVKIAYSFYATKRPFNPPAPGEGIRAPAGYKYLYLHWILVNVGTNDQVVDFGNDFRGKYGMRLKFDSVPAQEIQFSLRLVPGEPTEGGATLKIPENARALQFVMYDLRTGNPAHTLDL